jgi:hypothetical protein
MGAEFSCSQILSPITSASQERIDWDLEFAFDDQAVLQSFLTLLNRVAGKMGSQFRLMDSI